MICPLCLEEYELLAFDVDPDTLEHRGLFKCACEEPAFFPEFMTRDMLLDEEDRERLRLSRLFHLSRRAGQKALGPAAVKKKKPIKTV
jgi:hypothetical protein